MYSGEFKPKNSTTDRKGSNDMKANASAANAGKMKKMEVKETAKMEAKETPKMQAKEAKMGIERMSVEMKHADGKRHEDHHPAVKMAKGK
jgi:hypothetical protein